MSNYIKATNFAAKDTYTTGNPLKTVSGVEIDDEFTSIQTAVNSKADTSSPALTGAPTAPTAASGTNTTQVATTAFVQAATPTAATINALVYPVGSIFTTTYTYTDAAELATVMGVGTWEAFGGGKVLVGVDTSATPDTDFDTVEETGGSKTHTLTEAEMPAHNHKGNFMMESDSPSNDFASGTDTSVANPDGNALDHVGVGTVSKYNPITSTTGSGDPHNNVQPYITVYFWKRTA